MYYVYRHIRKDKNIPFYIGKGKGNRAYTAKNRNQYWHDIVNKHGYEVEIILDELTEKESFDKEIEFIKLYKDHSYCEANFTNGGEGISGYVHSKETRNKLSILNIGRVHTDETKEKIAQAGRDRTHEKWTDEQKLKHSIRTKDSNKRHIGNTYALGYKHSDNTKLKLSEINTGKKLTDETKTKLSIAHMGKKLSEGHKQKIGNSNKGKSRNCKIVICEQTGEIYNSTLEASKVLKLNQSNISAVCRGVRNHVNNMTFKYLIGE